MPDYAFVIDDANEDKIARAINSAPQYGAKVAGAIRRTIEVIHGLADLSQDFDLDEIEVYLGRTTGAAGVLNRFRKHRKTKGHKYGTILFTCDPDRALVLEATAVRILLRLKDFDTLCVGDANVAPGAQGNQGGKGSAVVYMTWRTLAERIDTEKPDVEVIRVIAAEVSEKMNREVTKQQIETGLLVTKRLSQKAKLEWYQPMTG